MKRVPVILILSFTIISYFLFSSVLSHYFISDDFVWLLNAKRDTWNEVARYPFDSQGFFYRPFTKFYFFLMWQWFGTHAWAYHLVNIVLHVLNSFVVYLLSASLLQRFFPDRNSRRISLFAVVSSLLFFIHPAHQENIIWISAVTELFPALFVLFALWLFVRKEKNGLFVSMLFFLCFILGLMSHEYVVIFPVLVFITDWFGYGRRSVLNHKKLYGGLILVDVLYLVLRAQSNSHWSGGDYSYNLVKLPFNVIGNLSGYIGLTVFGVPFVSFYQMLRGVMRDNLVLSAVLVVLLIAVTGYLIMMARKNYGEDHFDTAAEKFTLYVSLFFVVALLPFLGLGGLAERYVYLPSFAFLLFVSLFLYWIIRYFDVTSGTYTRWYGGILVLIGALYLFSAKQDQTDWKISSDFVYNRLEEFRTQCNQFTPGQTITRVSPPNRTGRAWTFQVGYEQGANVLCDKNIKILLK